MMLSITNAIHNVAQKAFHTMLLTGAFPEVHFEKSEHGTSYYMIEYAQTWAKFMKILDRWLKQEKMDERLGVFTRKHSADFLAKVERLANDITEMDMNGQVERFHSWLDDL